MQENDGEEEIVKQDDLAMSLNESSKINNSQYYKALKLLKLDEEREGFPITALREIQILKKLNHDNIVKLEDVFSFIKDEGLDSPSSRNWQRNRIYLVFEFVPHDLMGLIDFKPKFNAAALKCILK